MESGCAVFFGPARLAMVQELVPADERARAIGLQRSAMSTAALLGPPLAAPVLFGLGVQWGLALNAASFVVSAALQRRIRAEGRPPARGEDDVQGVVPELLDGVRRIAGNRVLRVVFGEVAIISVASGVFGSLMVFFITDNLHAPASSYGSSATVASAGGMP